MGFIRQAWRYMLGDPCALLFYLCFQPTRFRRETKLASSLKSVASKLRLILPIFVFFYPSVFVVQIVLHALFFIPTLSMTYFLLITALGTILGIVLAFLVVI